MSDTVSTTATPESSETVAVLTTEAPVRAKGVAYIKKEYLVEQTKPPNKRPAEESADEPPKKKKNRGQNKGRYEKNKTSTLKDKTEFNVRDNQFVKHDQELNKVDYEAVKKMRKKEYDYTKAEEVVAHVNKFIARDQEIQKVLESSQYQMKKIQFNIAQAKRKEAGEEPLEFQDIVEPYVETKYKASEIKRINFAGKLYMAPLTTVGNLPFRRVCKGFGVDITCGEMALASNLLKGQNGELSLLRRHECEDIFGIQVAGSNADTMTRLAQFIDEQLPHVDFVDINCGCPIDLLYNQGMGTGLMEKKSKLQGIVRGMKEILRIPLSVKMRTGIQTGKNIAHKMFPMVESWGADALTLHGRTKQQRYTKEADWDYIEQCASIVRKADDEDGFKKLYTIGNGDIFSYNQYKEHIPKVDCILIGRGALIKPWIFTEIKEERHWDISSNERLDILKNFAKYGMEHYGSDAYGISTTRKFLLEWIAFLYRYVPVGLLEHIPMGLNDRPPRFIGRNDLETLMASGDVTDWIKLTELAGLGPAPQDFSFTPKHKSNAYEADAEG